MKPRSRYIAHSSSFTHDFSSSRARCSARRSRPGSYGAALPWRRASRRARRWSSLRSMYGQVMSESRARTTIAVTQSATVTSLSRRPARCAREEDDAIGGARDLVERADELRFAPAGRGCHRDRGPHAEIELTAEFLDEALGVFGDRRVAFGDQLLTMPRTHAQELHPSRLWQRAGARPGTREPGARTLGQGEDIDRTRPRSEAPNPVTNCLLGDAFRRARGVQRRVAERQMRRQRRRVRAAGPVRRAVRIPLPRDGLEVVAVVEDVDRLLAVPAGDDHRARAEPVQRSCEPLNVFAGVLPGGLREHP